MLEDEYDDFYSKFYGIEGDHNVSAKVIQEIKSHIKNKDSRILEYGCATGYNLRYLQSEGFTNLYGVDGTSEFIDVIENKQNINFRCCNFAKEQLQNEEYDVIFCRGVLQQGETRCEKIKNSSEDVKRIVENFYTFLSKKGIIIIAEGPVRNWEQIFSHAGFNLILKNPCSNLYIFKK